MNRMLSEELQSEELKSGSEESNVPVVEDDWEIDGHSGDACRQTLTESPTKPVSMCNFQDQFGL